MALRLFQYDLSGMYLMTRSTTTRTAPSRRATSMPATARGDHGTRSSTRSVRTRRAFPTRSAPGLSLADNLVFTVTGDTPKNPLQRMGWPDGTPRTRTGSTSWATAT